MHASIEPRPDSYSLSYRFASAPCPQRHPPSNHSLPNRRSEEPSRGGRIRVRHPDRCIEIVHIVIRDTDTPPGRHSGICQIDRQDNDNRADGQARIQPGRRDVVKAHPPTSVLVPDVFVEDVADDTPSEVIERSSRWDTATAAEDEGGGEVAERSTGEGASEGVEEDGSQCAGHPEPLEIGVYRAGREDALRTNETPDDGSVEEDTTVGAIEFVDLVLGANI